MAFNPDEYLKKQGATTGGGFDPDAYLSKSDAPKADSGRVAQTALESFGNMATFGNLAQLQAGVAKLLPDPGREVDEELRSQGFTVQGPDTSYVAERDANIRRREALEAENPRAALAGKAAGFAATIPVLGGGSVAATTAGRAAQAARGGAIAGALTNPGDTAGEVASPLSELTQRAKQSATGAATGAVFQAGLEKVAAPVARAVGQKLGGSAERMATKALSPTKGQLEKLQASGQEQKLGRMLLDEGAIPAGGRTSAILRRVSERKESVGEKIGEILGSAGDKKLISGKVIANNLKQADEFVDVAAGIPGAEGLAGRAEKMLQTIRSRGQMSVKDAHQLRKQVDKLINFSKRNDELRGVEPQLYAIRTELNNAIQSVMNRFPGKQGEQLKRLNAAYSKLAEAERIAEGGVARAGANRTISLTDTIAAMGGLASGGPGLAVAAGAANKLARTYGRTTAARGLNLAGKAATKAGEGVSRGASSPITRAMVARLSAPSTGQLKPGESSPLQDPQILGIFRENPTLIDEIKDPAVRDQIRSLLDRQPSGK